jgi:3-phenylpropionate/cinnamic acid dioxygenase small subunit
MDGGPANADEGSLEKRVQRIEDEKQIRDLTVRYGQYLDALDFGGYSQLFAREGEWSGQLSGFTTVKSPAMIRLAMEKAFADRTYDPDHVTNLHLVSNIRIDVDDDRATGYSRWTVLSRNGNDEPYVRLSGHYDDVYIREDGRWKFLSRIARREIP